MRLGGSDRFRKPVTFGGAAEIPDLSTGQAFDRHTGKQGEVSAATLCCHFVLRWDGPRGLKGVGGLEPGYSCPSHLEVVLVGRMPEGIAC
ncbi:hypothetical protein FKM82_025754 [Ascaphus truei]